MNILRALFHVVRIAVTNPRNLAKLPRIWRDNRRLDSGLCPQCSRHTLHLMRPEEPGVLGEIWCNECGEVVGFFDP